MVPTDESGSTAVSSESTQRSYVYCPECGAKASADWSFCRSCNSSLEDAESPSGLIVRNDGEDVDLTEFVDETTGCEKCGHTDPAVEDVAMTSNDMARALDVESRRFKAVSCTRCGYTEYYKGRRPQEARDLFLR
ncbi:MAG: zinc ribbon domain-containing protein [Halovenus sp.]